MRKVISEEYLDYIRAKPCTACGKRPVDPDHIKARGWESAKRVDVFALPMCREHHSERGQIGNQKFEVRHDLNLWRCVAELMCEFFIERGENDLLKKP